MRRRARGHPALLVRPRRRRRAHRLGRAAGQGPRRCPRCRRIPTAGEHPHADRDELHDIYRAWRAIADSYPGTRVLVGEVWLPDAERFAEYLRPRRDAHRVQLRLHGPPVGRRRAAASPSTRPSPPTRPVGAPATWVLSNHDVTRPVTRYGREDTLVPSPPSASARRPTSRSARAGPGPRPCSPPPCPARSTSTRATSSACPRWRTSRSSASRTRCTSAPAASTPGATAAGCPCPGRATSRRSGSARRAGAEPWLPQPADGRRSPSSAGGRPGVDARALPRALAVRRRARPRRRAARLAADAAATSSRSGAATSPASSTSATTPSLPAHGRRPRRQRAARRGLPAHRHRRLARADASPDRRPARPPVTDAQPPDRPHPHVQPRRRHQDEHDEPHPDRRQWPGDAPVGRAAAVGAQESARGRSGHDARSDGHHHASRPAARHHRGGAEAFAERVDRSKRPTRTSRSSPPSTSGGPTFAAQLAGGTLPTVFAVPFTDAKTLIEHGQIADIDHEVKALPYGADFNPNVLTDGPGRRRQHLRVPTAAYAHRPALQPPAVQAGRPRPRQAADHLGRGARGRQGDRRRDRKAGYAQMAQRTTRADGSSPR